MASRPSSAQAIESSDIASRSPQGSNMSSSRRDGEGLIALAFSISEFVVLPIADTTTTTFLPAALVRAMRCATRRILSTSATEEPPYFWTTMPVGVTSCTIHDHNDLTMLPCSHEGHRRAAPSHLDDGLWICGETHAGLAGRADGIARRLRPGRSHRQALGAAGGGRARPRPKGNTGRHRRPHR